MKAEKILDEELEQITGGNAQNVFNMYTALKSNPKLSHYVSNSSPDNISCAQVIEMIKNYK